MEKPVELDVTMRLWRGAFPLLWIEQLKDILAQMYWESTLDQHMQLDGFVAHTMDQIVAACIGNGELWVCSDGTNLLGYMLGALTKDINNEMTYVVRQGWVHQSLRRSPKVKEMLRTILLNAKQNFCRHVVIVTSRNPDVYLRWLGKGWARLSTALRGTL